MTIPDYQSAMLPLLRAIEDGAEHRLRDVIEALAGEFGLTESERAELLPSGTAPLFDNRIGWARFYLNKAGLIVSPRRGTMVLTERGREVLAKGATGLTTRDLQEFAEFRDFRTRRREGTEESARVAPAAHVSDAEQTPEDRLAEAYRQLRESLEADLLALVKSCSPAFFERLVIDLLVAMGYGGSKQDAGQAIGRSGDGGIDGIIKEDRLGLDAIYLQAKRWEGTVGRPEIQKFAGALQGQRANKGVFITTSTFTREAREYVSVIPSKIILMDGEELARLMADFNVGVSTAGRYEIKRIDSDYFDG